MHRLQTLCLLLALTTPTRTLITPTTASEVVNLEPAWDNSTIATIVGANSACPHLASGLLSWDSVATWMDGSLPAAGEDVSIPDGVSVLITQSPLSDVSTHFGKVTIPRTSELIFGENAAGISFGATGFDIEGALRLGAPGCRLSSSISITLHGSRPTPGASGIIEQDPWVKGIYALNGTIDLHGHEYTRTWTRLAAQVSTGATVLHLQHAVNWEVGQTVLITGTTLKDARDFHQNEVRLPSE